MSEVTVRELRQNLSVHLRRVERGETLEVTRRGERVAVLAPLAERRSPSDWLAYEHGAPPPTARLEDLPERLEVEGASLSELLEQQREEGQR